MSTTLLKTAAVAAITFAGLATSAQSAEAQSRYGDIAAYEGVATNCAPVDCAAPVASTRYGSAPVVQQPVAPMGAPVMVDCSVFGTPGCGQPVIAQPTTVYTQPATTYAQSSYSQSQTYSQPSVQLYDTPQTTTAPANCPAGTTAQPDGTCLQGSSMSMGSSSTYSSASTYSSPAPVASMPANCPAGTTAQPDGTCMQGSSMSMGTTTMSTGSAMAMVDCPVGTTKQMDGTCAQTATVYGDASPSYGYGADGSYGAESYRPIRK